MQDEIHEMHIDYVKWTEFITKIYRKNIMMVFGKFNWSIVTKNGVHEQNIIDHQGSLNEWDVMSMWNRDLHLFDKDGKIYEFYGNVNNDYDCFIHNTIQLPNESTFLTFYT